jgi:polyribonucleotide nucleotidyltransferase
VTPPFGELRDVNQPVLGSEEVHEGAELHHLDHFTLVDFADLGLGGDGLDAVDRGADRLGVGRGDLDRTVVGDVDLGARLGDEVKVKVIGFDDRGKVKLSMKVVDQNTGKELEKAEAAS